MLGSEDEDSTEALPATGTGTGSGTDSDSDSDAHVQPLPDAPVAPETRTGHIGALCNAIVLAAPRAHFLRLWHLEYSRFDAREWSWHSVHLPAVLASVRFSSIFCLLERAF